MIKCTAENCNSTENKDSSITFHKYPLFDKNLLKSWLENIAPPNYEPQPDDYICSLHFTYDQFIHSEPRRLIRYAVPTIHTDETNINSCEDKTANINKEYESEECSADGENASSEETASADEDSSYEETNTRKRKKFCVPRYVGDFKEEDLKNPEKMKRMWEIAYRQISEQKNKLKTITQRNRRLEGQVTRLKNVIKHLKSVHK